MGKQVRKQKASSIVAGGFFRFAFYLGVTVAMIYAGKSAYDFGYNIFYQEAVASEENARDITVVIKKGDSTYQMGKILEDKGLIEDAKVFVVQELLSSYKGKLQPGTYVLKTSMTADEIMGVLARENTEGQPDQTDSSGKAKEGNSDIQHGAEGSSEEAAETEDTEDAGEEGTEGGEEQ